MTEQMLHNLVLQVDAEIQSIMSNHMAMPTLRDMKRKQADLEELILARANILAVVEDEPVIRPVKVRTEEAQTVVDEELLRGLS